MATELVQARIDRDLKESVSEVLEANGLDIPTAIRMFFAKIVMVGGIPFDVRVDLGRNFPAATALPAEDFDRLLEALDAPLPPETIRLLKEQRTS